VVSVDNAAAIFQAARHPKSFLSLVPSDHLLTKAADAEYAATIITAWLSRFFPGTGTTLVWPTERQLLAE
jgi:putative redox protein